MMEHNPFLETYLHQIHLPAFIKHYLPFAADASHQNLDYTRYLLALVEQEIQWAYSHSRDQWACSHNRILSRVKDAHFPVAKKMAELD